MVMEAVKREPLAPTQDLAVLVNKPILDHLAPQPAQEVGFLVRSQLLQLHHLVVLRLQAQDLEELLELAFLELQNLLELAFLALQTQHRRNQAGAFLVVDNQDLVMLLQEPQPGPDSVVVVQVVVVCLALTTSKIRNLAFRWVALALVLGRQVPLEVDSLGLVRQLRVSVVDSSNSRHQLQTLLEALEVRPKIKPLQDPPSVALVQLVSPHRNLAGFSAVLVQIRGLQVEVYLVIIRPTISNSQQAPAYSVLPITNLEVVRFSGRSRLQRVLEYLAAPHPTPIIQGAGCLVTLSSPAMHNLSKTKVVSLVATLSSNNSNLSRGVFSATLDRGLVVDCLATATINNRAGVLFSEIWDPTINSNLQAFLETTIAPAEQAHLEVRHLSRMPFSLLNHNMRLHSLMGYLLMEVLLFFLVCPLHHK